MMRRLLLSLGSLWLTACGAAYRPPVVTPPPGAVCRVDEGHYVCARATGSLVPVERDWFKAHCRTEERRSDGAVAACDAFAPDAIVQHPAAPSKVRARMKAIGYGAAAAGFMAICAYSAATGGGCGFMGGGLQ